MDTFTIMVKPALSWARSVVNLGPIDQIAPRCYMTAIFCFRIPPGTQKNDLIHRLRRMILLTVQEIPQLATTVVSRNNSREELELAYLEDTGAYLTFKDYTAKHLQHEWKHGTFDDLSKQHFPYKKLERRTLTDGFNSVHAKGLLPALMIQANLIPGGLILVSALHHAVCDGMGHFICNATLAKHCRGTSGLAIEASHIDFADRTTIIKPDPYASLQDLPNWKLVASGEDFLQPTHYDSKELPPLQCATYYISEERIAKLRATFTVGGQKPSIVEAIGAVLWQHVVQARDIDIEKFPEAKLSLTVNTRTRMREPSIAPLFWGNMSEPNAVASMPADKFSSSSAEFLPAAAQRIRAAIADVNAPAVRRLVGLLAQLPKATSLTWNVNRWPGPDMLIVTLHAMPYYDLDFGPELGGCCEAFRAQIGDIEGKPDGRCILLPREKGDGKGLEVMLQYETSTLQRLDADREFTKWFERRS